MYLPTFWKLYSEVWMHKGAKIAGWGLPAGVMSKSFFHSNSPQAQNILLVSTMAK